MLPFNDSCTESLNYLYYIKDLNDYHDYILIENIFTIII